MNWQRRKTGEFHFHNIIKNRLLLSYKTCVNFDSSLINRSEITSANRMKLITCSNSISGLKILLAAEFENVKLDVDLSGCPEKSYLVVNDDVRLFSANSAVWYLTSLSGKKSKSHLDDWFEWESTHLNLQVEAFLTKNPNTLLEALNHLDKSLRNKFILSVSLS